MKVMITSMFLSWEQSLSVLNKDCIIMQKNKIEWAVGFQMELSKVVTYSKLTTREKARAHMRGMKGLMKESNNTTAKIWLERQETIHSHTAGNDSFTIYNAKRVR